MEGGTRAQWIIQTIRGVLTNHPQFTEGEVEALQVSNHQLRALGRNLNQVARHLNEGQTQQTVELELIEQLQASIKAHTGKVDDLMKASAERWVIE